MSRAGRGRVIHWVIQAVRHGSGPVFPQVPRRPGIIVTRNGVKCLHLFETRLVTVRLHVNRYMHVTRVAVVKLSGDHLATDPSIQNRNGLLMRRSQFVGPLFVNRGWGVAGVMVGQ